MQEESTERPSGFDVFEDNIDLGTLWERRGAFPSGDRRTIFAAVPAADPRNQVRELCHDLRQPLAVAAALASTLQGHDGLIPADRDRISMLRRQLQQLSELVAAALMPTTPSPVDLSALARDVCQSEDAVADRPIERVVEDDVVLQGDVVELRRLISNLLVNARRAAGPGGRVRLLVATQPGQATIEVDDSGDGALDAARSTGLGLLIASGVCERHGGHMESGHGDLGGLRVRVLLPLPPPEADAPS